jgi:hypothetical protein
VRYFANPVPPAVPAMNAGLLGMIATPAQRRPVPPLATWCADNGCFGVGFPGVGPWLEWLAGFTEGERARCAFATAPDVVADHDATVTRSGPWLDRIRQLGYPAAFVAQDGARPNSVPWDTFDVLFIGGSTRWKLGPEARAVIRRAHDHARPVHMGRVNTWRRLRYAAAVGAASVDGTYLTYGPDVNTRRLLAWMDRLEREVPLPLT